MMKIKLNDRVLTAYVLDELSPRKRRAVERALETDTVSRRIVEELQKTILLTGEAIKEAPEYSLLPEQRSEIIARTTRSERRSGFDYGFPADMGPPFCLRGRFCRSWPVSVLCSWPGSINRYSGCKPALLRGCRS